MKESSSTTSVNLVGRLRHAPTDTAAWDEFVRRYRPRIHGWCRGWGLQDTDAEDVTQNVLVEIARQMRTFRYDPTRSFRAWLKVLTHGAWCDFLDSHPERGRGSGDSAVLRLLQAVEAPDDLARQLEDEYERHLLEEASAQVQKRVEPRTWEAFRLLAFEDLSGREAAARLGMKVGAVFVAKGRVQKLLKTEIRRLEASCEESP